MIFKHTIFIFTKYSFTTEHLENVKETPEDSASEHVMMNRPRESSFVKNLEVCIESSFVAKSHFYGLKYYSIG